MTDRPTYRRRTDRPGHREVPLQIRSKRPLAMIPARGVTEGNGHGGTVPEMVQVKSKVTDRQEDERDRSRDKTRDDRHDQ